MQAAPLFFELNKHIVRKIEKGAKSLKGEREIDGVVLVAKSGKGAPASR
jgi:hypothetical protein